MPTPLDAPLPANLDLGPGFTLRVTALAVADGSQLSSVIVSQFSVLLEDLADLTAGGPVVIGPDMLVPGPNG